MRPVRSSPLRSALSRRFASSDSSSSSSSSSTAVKARSAAQSAQKSISAISAGGLRLLSKAGDRASGLLGSYREPFLFNLAVGREIAKQVYKAERLAPPTSFAEIKSAYTTLASRAASFSYWSTIARSGEWKRVAFYTAEAVGIFSIGEMIGRRHMVGYKVE